MSVDNLVSHSHRTGPAIPTVQHHWHSHTVAQGLYRPGRRARVKAHRAARLSDYKVPESDTVLATPLPRHANGKPLKREMREQVRRLSPVLDQRI